MAATFVAAQEGVTEDPASRHHPSRVKKWPVRAVPLSAAVDAFIIVPVLLISTYSILLCRSRRLNNSRQIVLESSL